MICNYYYSLDSVGAGASVKQGPSAETCTPGEQFLPLHSEIVQLWRPQNPPLLPPPVVGEGWGGGASVDLLPTPILAFPHRGGRNSEVTRRLESWMIAARPG